VRDHLYDLNCDCDRCSDYFSNPPYSPRWFVTIPELSGVQYDLIDAGDLDQAQSLAIKFAFDRNCRIEISPWQPGPDKCTWLRLVTLQASQTGAPSLKSIPAVSRIGHWLSHVWTGKCKNRVCIWGNDFTRIIDDAAQRLAYDQGVLKVGLVYDECSGDFPAPDVLAAWLHDRDETNRKVWPA
jgi:hypothetical protein